MKELTPTQTYLANLVIQAWAMNVIDEETYYPEYVLALERVAEHNGIDLSQLRDAVLNNEMEDLTYQAQELERIKNDKTPIIAGEAALKNIEAATKRYGESYV
jgi:hypothetical protein